MTISHLFDHTCAVWRKAETLGSHGETVKGFSIAYSGLGLKADRKQAPLAEAGPGIVQVGGRRLFFELGSTFLKRDLIELLTGPDAPELLEVEFATRPRGHHIEVWATDYEGDEPEIGS